MRAADALYIPEDRKRVFEKLPHLNPFFDIKNALRYIYPLNKTYSESTETAKKAKVINDAYELLINRQEHTFVNRFHRLAEEFLKEYRNHFPDKRIQKLVEPMLGKNSSAERESLDLNGIYVREAILKQEAIVPDYFRNFYFMSVEYHYFVRESSSP